VIDKATLATPDQVQGMLFGSLPTGRQAKSSQKLLGEQMRIVLIKFVVLMTRLFTQTCLHQDYGRQAPMLTVLVG